MIKIPEHIAKDILAQLVCDQYETCDKCRLQHADCDENREICIGVLHGALDAAKQNADVSQETAANDTALAAEPERASKYITIPVAEYHFLTKAATLLETALAADRYNPKATLDAVRTVVQEMIQQAEAGAAE